MKPFNILEKRTTLFLSLVTAMGVNMSWLQFNNNEISGSATLASTSVCSVNDISCDLEVSLKNTQLKIDEKARFQYTIEKVDMPSQTEAGGLFSGSGIPSVSLDSNKKAAFRVVVTDLDCGECEVFSELKMFPTDGTINQLQILQQMHSIAKAIVNKAGSTKLDSLVASKKEEEEEKKRLAKIENCEIDEDGEKMKSTSTEYFECLGDRVDTAADDKTERKFLSKLKEAMNTSLFQSGSEVRANAVEFLAEYRTAFGKSSEYGKLFSGMYYSGQMMKDMEKYALAAASTNNAQEKKNINYALDQRFEQYKYKMVNSGAYQTSNGYEYAMATNSIASAIQENPRQALLYLGSMNGDGDDSLLSGLSILNLDGSPIVGNNLLGTNLLTSQVVPYSGRYLRSDATALGSIPQLGTVGMLNRDMISSGTNSLLNPSSAQLQRNSLVNGAPQLGQTVEQSGVRFIPIATN